MGNLHIKLDFGHAATSVPNNFIEHYMAACPPVYSLVYIFALRSFYVGQDITTAALAAQFNVTENDISNAWHHWHNAGVVSFDAKNGTLTFLEVGVPEKPQDLPPPTKPAIGVRPQYTVDELTMYRQENRGIARIFTCAEKTLGKLLYYTEMNIVFSFYDWLRLPLDVIEYLFAYCEENGHRNLRYIEKCAIDWADNDVIDIEKALEYVQNFDKNYRTILHYMGQTTAYPTPSQRKYMDKWLFEWQMSLELIMEACDRCVAQINKPKFNYVDSILANWYKAKIHDLAAVKAADSAFETQAFVKTENKPRTNRFVNFEQRENDYSKLEQMEREYLQKKINSEE